MWSPGSVACIIVRCNYRVVLLWVADEGLVTCAVLKQGGYDSCSHCSLRLLRCCRYDDAVVSLKAKVLETEGEDMREAIQDKVS